MKKKIILACIFLLVVFFVIYFFYSGSKENVENIELFNSQENIELKNETMEENEILGTLKIEKIGLEAPIKEGSDSEVLKEYIGHIEESSIFDGNVGLAAHNRGNEFSYFSKLNELSEGDCVEYKTNYGTRVYKVETIKVILETDWTMLANSKENKLTMITCINNRPTQRLCVQAVEI